MQRWYLTAMYSKEVQFQFGSLDLQSFDIILVSSMLVYILQDLILDQFEYLFVKERVQVGKKKESVRHIRIDQRPATKFEYL